MKKIKSKKIEKKKSGYQRGDGKQNFKELAR